MKKIKFNSYGKEYKGFITVDKYSTWNNIQLQLWTENEDYGFPEPYATMTVNLAPITGDYAYLDINNFPDVVNIFKKYKLGTPTDLCKTSGFCVYPFYKLNMEEIYKYQEA